MHAFSLSREDARDLAQDTFVQVYLRMDAYRQESEWSFIQTVGRRLALNKLRDRAAQKRSASVDLPVEAIDAYYELEHQQPSPERVFEARERAVRLKAAIAELPPKLRDCILLQLQALTYAEIAAMLHINAAIVKSRLYEARVQLQQVVNEDDVIYAMPDEEATALTPESQGKQSEPPVFSAVTSTHEQVLAQIVASIEAFENVQRHLSGQLSEYDEMLQAHLRNVERINL